MQLLFAAKGSDGNNEFIAVSGTAVRLGNKIEAFGVGGEMFRFLADRFFESGFAVDVAEVFSTYAMQAVKQSVPGCGGNTRMVILRDDGTIHYKNSFEIAAIQNYFREFDSHIRSLLLGVPNIDRDSEEEVEKLLQLLSRFILDNRKQLEEHIRFIRSDKTLC